MKQYKNNIHTGKAAQIGVVNGVNKIADAVKLTLGAKGANAILEEDLSPFHIITNDGISIIERAYFEDPLEAMGLNIIKEVASRTNRQSGDGTTTSTVLAQAILNEGLATGISGMEISNSLNELIPFIEEKIDAQKKTITPDEVAAVATISAEDPALGQTLQEIYQKIGKDGIVELDNSKTYETTYEIKEGVRFRAGFISPYLANEGKQAVYKNPAVLVAKKKISTLSDIAPVVELCVQHGKTELVIFCDDIDAAVVGTLVGNHLQGVYKFLIIKAPIIWKDLIFEDFAKVTGATIIDDKAGLSWNSFRPESGGDPFSYLGTIGKIITDKDETTLLGIKDVSEHVEELRNKGDDDSLRRVCWLTTKAAVLKLGANSDSELSYKRLKAEDAINAARLALEDGVVAGGGVALLNVAKELSHFDQEKNLGAKILTRALRAPFEQIVVNAGVTVSKKMSEKDWESWEKAPESIMLTSVGGNYGFNAKTGKIVDMWEAAILDPAKVTKNAVKTAISVCSKVLSIQVAIPKDKEAERMADMVNMMRQPRF